MKLVNGYISDERIRRLVEKFVRCRCEHDDVFYDIDVGIVQGNPISPILSNIYLHELDVYMTERGWHWIRFSDDLNIYAENSETAEVIYEDVVERLERDFLLKINDKKSGVKNVIGSSYLGFDFYRHSGAVDVRKHVYKKTESYRKWQKCSVTKVNQEYHIVQNGVINKKDYSLLFENEQEKHHIPVEVLDQLNIYSNVTISSAVLGTLAKENIRVLFLDKFGDLVGTFVPDGYEKDAKVTLQQALLYSDTERREQYAKCFEEAGFHNMRANLRYYIARKKII